jgi:hypothetical protein
MATAEITVAVEKAAHDAMRELAQAIWDKHGVCVRSVRFSWVDVSGMGEPRLLVTDVEAETLTKARSKGTPVIPQPTPERREL